MTDFHKDWYEYHTTRSYFATSVLFICFAALRIKNIPSIKLILIQPG